MIILIQLIGAFVEQSGRCGSAPFSYSTNRQVSGLRGALFIKGMFQYLPPLKSFEYIK